MLKNLETSVSALNEDMGIIPEYKVEKTKIKSQKTAKIIDLNFDIEILQCDPEILIFKNQYLNEIITEPENGLVFDDNDSDLIGEPSKSKGIFGHLGSSASVAKFLEFLT